MQTEKRETRAAAAEAGEAAAAEMASMLLTSVMAAPEDMASVMHSNRAAGSFRTE